MIVNDNLDLIYEQLIQNYNQLLKLDQLIPRGIAEDVVPNDTVDLATPTVAVYVGGAGNLKVDMVDGGTVSFNGLAAGTALNIRVKRVYATGTTATNIIALR